jgi:hypothetical protein
MSTAESSKTVKPSGYGEVRRLRLPRDARRLAPLKRLPKLVGPSASMMEAAKLAAANKVATPPPAVTPRPGPPRRAKSSMSTAPQGLQ